MSGFGTGDWVTEPLLTGKNLNLLYFNFEISHYSSSFCGYLNPTQKVYNFKFIANKFLILS